MFWMGGGEEVEGEGPGIKGVRADKTSLSIPYSCKWCCLISVHCS